MFQKMHPTRLELMLSAEPKVYKNTRNPARIEEDKKYIDDYMTHNIIDNGTELWASAEKRKGLFGKQYKAHVWSITKDKKSTFHFEVNAKKIYNLLKRLYEQQDLKI
ncbi:MAG: hypothetical protein ABIB71_08035 [Candidatus Woesearchaeota archaeon]